MHYRMTRILEIVWITLAVLSLLAGFYNWYHLGLDESVMFFVITVLSLFMYIYRRNMRRSQKR